MWSVAAKHKDDGAQSDPTVNYNTYALGREGYITLDLITQQSQVPKDKGAVLALLNNIDYVEGKRYADFNSSTDKVAEYGLAALVAGVAAKKLGLFAVIGAFLLKFAKVGLIAVAALGGGIWSRLRRKKADPAGPASSDRTPVKVLLLLLSGFKYLKFGKLLATGGSMLLSVAAYAWVFGWRYAAGFVLLLLVHELGHYVAARQRGLEVGAPVFIPFVGAWIQLKDQPLNADTEAYVGWADPSRARWPRWPATSPRATRAATCCWRCPTPASSSISST